MTERQTRTDGDRSKASSTASAQEDGANVHPQSEVIYYLCPDIHMASAGIRRLYRHVHLLRDAGFDAHILHLRTGFERADMPEVSVKYLDRQLLEENAVVVIPEGFPTMMDALKTFPLRRFAIALNWDYVFKNLPQGVNWKSFNVERVLAISPVISEVISWSMGLPCHLLASSIDHDLYFIEDAPKRIQVVYIQRKAPQVEILKRLLEARNPEFTHHIKWLGLDALAESEYAAQVRQSSVFLNLSPAEGYPTSCIEAMAAGAIVAGYDAIGGRGLLVPYGEDQNCILTDNGNYPALAYALEPLLNDLLRGRIQQWAPILASGTRTSAGVCMDNERESLISFWKRHCLN